MNHIVKVWSKSGEHCGWEMQCNHPLHQKDKRCRINRRNTAHGRTEELTRQMLLEWAHRGRNLDSWESHAAEWSSVELEGFAGDLPAVPAQVTEYRRSNGEVVPLPRKRRRHT